MSWKATVITLLPDAFPGPLGHSLAGRALQDGLWSLDIVKLRDFGIGKHQDVDDTPAGGGVGMVMRPDVAAAAIDAAIGSNPDAPRLALSPRGTPLTQQKVRALSAAPGVILFCSRFEGLDERVLETRDIEEVSIGDYILSGGETAALVLLDAAVRLLPGVMGKAESGQDESFENDLLEYPHYTRPAQWEGKQIPEVLTSGDHGKIAEWRRQKSEQLTSDRRPDLWAGHKKKRDNESPK